MSRIFTSNVAIQSMLPFNISSLPDFTEFRLQDEESAVPWTNSLGVRYLHDTWFGKSLIKMKTF